MQTEFVILFDGRWLALPVIHVKNEDYGGLNPVACGWEQCEPGHSYGPAVRTHWLLHYIVSGSGSFQIGERSYGLKPGSMFVIPPYVETFYQADRQDPWQYIWVGFTCLGELPVQLRDVMECPGALRIFQSMKQSQKQESGRSAYLSSCLWELVAHLLEREGHKPDMIDKALGMIQAEYADGITVEQIARRLNVGRSYLSTQFRKRVGVSPMVYLMDLRMKVAATLLTSGTSVSVTANSVGYADIYIFSKMFKRHYRCSPRAYVQCNRQPLDQVEATE